MATAFGNDTPLARIVRSNLGMTEDASAADVVEALNAQRRVPGENKFGQQTHATEAGVQALQQYIDRFYPDGNLPPQIQKAVDDIGRGDPYNDYVLYETLTGDARRARSPASEMVAARADSSQYGTQGALSASLTPYLTPHPFQADIDATNVTPYPSAAQGAASNAAQYGVPAHIAQQVGNSFFRRALPELFAPIDRGLGAFGAGLSAITALAGAPALGSTAKAVETALNSGGGIGHLLPWIVGDTRNLGVPIPGDIFSWGGSVPAAGDFGAPSSSATGPTQAPYGDNAQAGQPGPLLGQSTPSGSAPWEWTGFGGLLGGVGGGNTGGGTNAPTGGSGTPTGGSSGSGSGSGSGGSGSGSGSLPNVPTAAQDMDIFSEGGLFGGRYTARDYLRPIERLNYFDVTTNPFLSGIF